MNIPLSPTGEHPAFDPGTRTVLPLSEAVKGPQRFQSATWSQSSLCREVLDSFDSPLVPVRPAPQAPRPISDDFGSESIVMAGATVTRTWRKKTAAHTVRQVTSSPLEPVPVLAILPDVQHVDTGTRDAAAEALTAMANRPHARRGHRLPRKPLTAPLTASTGALWAAFTIAAAVVAMLLKVIFTGSLI